MKTVWTKTFLIFAITLISHSARHVFVEYNTNEPGGYSIIFKIEQNIMTPDAQGTSPIKQCSLPRLSHSLKRSGDSTSDWTKIHKALSSSERSGVPFSSLPLESLDPANWHITGIRVIRCETREKSESCVSEMRWIAQPLVYEKSQVTYIADAAVHLIWKPKKPALPVASYESLYSGSVSSHEAKQSPSTRTDRTRTRLWDCQHAGGEEIEKILSEISKHHELEFIDWMTSDHAQMKWAFGSLTAKKSDWSSDILPSGKRVELVSLSEFKYDDDSIRRSFLKGNVDLENPELFLGSPHSRRGEISCVGCHLHASLHMKKNPIPVPNQVAFSAALSQVHLRHFSYLPNLEHAISLRFLHEIGELSEP